MLGRMLANVKKLNIAIIIVLHMNNLNSVFMELIKIVDLAVLLKGSVVIVDVVESRFVVKVDCCQSFSCSMHLYPLH